MARRNESSLVTRFNSGPTITQMRVAWQYSHDFFVFQGQCRINNDIHRQRLLLLLLFDSGSLSYCALAWVAPVVIAAQTVRVSLAFAPPGAPVAGVADRDTSLVHFACSETGAPPHNSTNRAAIHSWPPRCARAQPRRASVDNRDGGGPIVPLLRRVIADRRPPTPVPRLPPGLRCAPAAPRPVPAPPSHPRS